MFIEALFIIAKIWRQPKCPSPEEWAKNMDYYSAIKNKEILSSNKWMDLESIMLSKISQAEKDKYSLLSLICRI